MLKTYKILEVNTFEYNKTQKNKKYVFITMQKKKKKHISFLIIII